MAYYSDVKTFEDKQMMHELANAGFLPELMLKNDNTNNEVSDFFEILSEKINYYTMNAFCIFLAVFLVCLPVYHLLNWLVPVK